MNSIKNSMNTTPGKGDNMTKTELIRLVVAETVEEIKKELLNSTYLTDMEIDGIMRHAKHMAECRLMLIDEIWENGK